MDLVDSIWPMATESIKHEGNVNKALSLLWLLLAMDRAIHKLIDVLQQKPKVQ